MRDEIKIWCAEKDSNLHALWALPPQGSVYTNFTIRARTLILPTRWHGLLAISVTAFLGPFHASTAPSVEANSLSRLASTARTASTTSSTLIANIQRWSQGTPEASAT